MQNPKKEQILFTATAFLLLLMYIIGLFFNVTGDAAKYAYIAKSVAENNEWLQLKIQGEPYFQKPQFLFWLSAISFKCFGVSNFTFKLPIFLYSILGFWATFKFGESLYNRKTGFMAATMLAFSGMSLLYNADIHTDIVLQTNVILSMWLLYEFLKSKKTKFLLGGALAVGLSILTKGPIGAIIPFFAVLGYIISQRQFKLLYSPVWLVFVLIVMLTISPALIPLIQQHGSKGLWFFFWQNNVGRVTGSYMGTNHDPFYYIHSLAYMLLPWSLVIGAGVYLQYKKLFQKQFSAQDQFLFWGTWILFIIMSAAKSKLQNYVQALVPLLFISAAVAWQHYSALPKNPWRKAQQIIIYLLCALAVAIPPLISPLKGLLISLIEIGIISIGIVLSKEMEIDKKLFYRTLITMVVMAFFMNGFLLPKLLSVQADKSASQIISNNTIEGEQVYNYNLLGIKRKQQALLKNKKENNADNNSQEQKHFHLNYEMMFYGSEPIVHLNDQEDIVDALEDNGAWILTDPLGKEDILNRTEQIDSIYTLDHFSLRMPTRSFNKKKRRIEYEKMYLIHLSTGHAN